MGTVSGQAWRYGELLGVSCGVPVRLRWSDRPTRGVGGGWVVQWRDGPTEAGMRAHVGDVLLRSPASPGAEPAAALSYSRCLSPLGEAAALLLWLQGHPDALTEIGAVHLVAARDAVPYPERADDLTVARARALLARSPSGTLGYDVLRELAGRGRCGWVAVASWLDTEWQGSVVDLNAERDRRRAP